MAYAQGSSIRPRAGNRRGETAVVQRVRVYRGAPVPPQLGFFKKIGRWAKKQYGKGPSISGLKSSIKGTGHTVGKVLDSKITKGIVGGALALTGVGIPVSAGIMAAQGAAGGALKKGGGLRKAVSGAATGAATGAVAGVAGKLLPKIPKVGGQVMRFRRHIGTAPVLKAAESFDSDKRLDALANQTAPAVSMLPSNSVLTKMEPITQTAPSVLTTAAGVASTAATAVPEQNVVKRVLERAKREARRIAEQRATELAVGVSVPPSANPSVPQGGFPAEQQPFAPQAELPVAQAGVGGGIGEIMQNPVALGAIVLGVVMLSGKRR